MKQAAVPVNCEACPVRQALQYLADYPDEIEQIYRTDAPDATAAQIDQAVEKSRHMAEGMQSALPDCPGYDPRRAKTRYFLERLVNDRQNTSHRAASYACKNPYLKTEEYDTLEYETSPDVLQTEALKTQGEQPEEAGRSGIGLWPPSKFINAIREGYRSSGVLGKCAMWLMATSAVVQTVAILRIPIPPDRPKIESEQARIERLAKEYQTSTYDAAQRKSFNALVTLTPETIDGARTYRAKVELGRTIQKNVVVVSQQSFKKGLDHHEDVDEFSVAQDLIPQETLDEIKKDGLKLEAVSPVSCSISNEYNPLDYSNHTAGEFAVRAKSSTDTSTVVVPLGGPQTIRTYDNASGKLSEISCRVFPKDTHLSNPNYLKIVY